MGNDVTLSAAIRESLGSLKESQFLAKRSASRLSTGLKVNDAKDDAVAFFQARALSDRSRDFVALKDGINQAISTLTATLDGVASIESLVKQLKGLAMGAGGMTASQLADTASQWDDLRNQITNLAEDTVYNGSTMLSSTQSLRVDTAPAGAHTVEIAGKDLRVNNQVVDEDIKAVWFDDSDGNSLEKITTRSFTISLSPTSNESMTAVVGQASSGESLWACRTLDGGTAIAYGLAGGTGTGLRIVDASGAAVCPDITVDSNNDAVVFGMTVLEDGRIAVGIPDVASGLPVVNIYKPDGTVDTSISVSCPGINLGDIQASLSATADGGFTVTWLDGSDDMNFAHYDSTPSVVTGATVLNQNGGGQTTHPSVAGMSNGSSVLTWLDYSLTPDGIMARIVNSSGSFVGNEFQVDTAGVATDYPNVAALADGGFAITWQSDSGVDNDIKGKVYNADGTVRTAEFTVTSVANNQTVPKITGLPSGGFAVSWTDNGTDGSSFGAYAATFDANGTSAVAATQLNQTTAGAQGDTAIVKYSLVH
jgi:flagellin-like hook-associated protein FlgL